MVSQSYCKVFLQVRKAVWNADTKSKSNQNFHKSCTIAFLGHKSITRHVAVRALAGIEFSLFKGCRAGSPEKRPVIFVLFFFLCELLLKYD